MLRRIVFRVDASPRIGTGHVFRCLSVADALAKAGVTCHFAMTDHPENLAELVMGRGHVLHRLNPVAGAAPHPAPPPHAPWLAGSWQQDARQTRDILAMVQPDWLILDHYALDAMWEDTARGTTPLAVIDDLADRPHSADLLLDSGLDRLPRHYAALVPKNCKLLLGPEFSLLRDEFARLRSRAEQRRATHEDVRSLLVTLGGMDPDNILQRLLDILIGLDLHRRFIITAIAGRGSTLATPEGQARMRADHGIRVLSNVTNVGELILNADLCIGAAGSTSWERCCLGLPTLMLVLADNQSSAAARVADHGAGLSLGRIDALTPDALRDGIDHFTDPPTYADAVQAAFAVTDGLGVSRFLHHLGLPD